MNLLAPLMMLILLMALLLGVMGAADVLGSIDALERALSVGEGAAWASR